MLVTDSYCHLDAFLGTSFLHASFANAFFTVSALIMLLKDASPKVRSRTAEAMGLLFDY